ncbi:Gfo/Idh/MocA family oxidoreductase [Streptomyces phaeolivaceus]|uniref:Gfo/Idh/MocA family oxidoreductase n=1 Tax=Streptomyces phaeolivaceus TaxID=2653200 RepID=A0A5P8KCD3_9ACTN|nr:Gfo/Idh/MocA family oxidoreductase [Streptomyces phaeolivaceus]QFR00802.1 Gfo/Idh/MocA family oxidoreductase [Streptomyces phaeolivaceus]
MVNLRAAIVGCGRSASAAHASAHAADPRVHLAAVVDPDHGRARALARRFGVREVFASLEEMLATTDVDLVSVCVPPPLSAPLTRTALRAGCHVLCEPPVAAGSADLARMAEIAKAEHRVLTHAFPYRHLTETRTARGIVDAGEIGEIHEVQLVARGCGEVVGGEWCADRDRGLRDERAEDDVRARSRSADGLREPSAADVHPRRQTPGGCGPLTDIGIHLLDLAMWITGFPEPVETLWTTPDRPLGRGETAGREGVRAEAQAARAPGRPGRPEEGTAAADARAARAVAHAATGLTAADGRGPLGDRGTALIRCRDGMSLSLTTSHAASHLPASHHTPSYPGAHAPLYATPYATSYATSYATPYAADPPDAEAVRVRLVGDRGALEIFPLLLSHANRPAPRHTRPPLPGNPWDLQLARRRQIAAFVDACLGRGPAPVTTAEALHVQEVVDRLRHASHGTPAPGEPDARSRSRVPGPADPHDADAPTTVHNPVQEASRA